jgi:hypothetical protein
MKYAPVILFVYNRPSHTLRTLESLDKNVLAGESELFIYADGPKKDASADALSSIALTREIITSRQWCGKTTVLESDVNKGLAVSITEGVSEIIRKYGRAIILEDDHVTSPAFLSFMNEALDKYEQEKKVACISGYVYPLATKFNEAFFIKGADCWGWATWSDRWNPEEANAGWLRKELSDKKLLDDFTFNGSYPYLEMLMDREQGKNQSWAIIWYAASLLRGKLCLYPPYSLVRNIGNDGSGTHTTSAVDKYDTELKEVSAIRFPSSVEESVQARAAFEQFFRSASRENLGLASRIIRRLKKIFS